MKTLPRLESAKFNQEHRKVLREVTVKPGTLRRDGTGAVLKTTDATTLPSRVQVDLSTVSGGLVLAFHPDRGSGLSKYKSAMIRVDDLAQPGRDAVLKEAKALRKSGGFSAPASGVTYTVKAKPLAPAARAGFTFLTSNGKDADGRFQDFFEKYGTGTQAGTWTTPGSGSVGQGGLRTLLANGEVFHATTVKSVTGKDANPKDGIDGAAKFIYGYVERPDARGVLQKQFMWTLHSAKWWQTDPNGVRVGSVKSQKSLR